MRRWTATFALLTMLIPAFGPLALAYVAPANGMHCMRRPLTAVPSHPDPGATSGSGMHCHHGAVESPAAPADFEASIRSLDCCCHYGDCCCRLITSSEWAQPASHHFSSLHERIGLALSPAVTARIVAFVSGPDSARAPPRH